MRRRARSAKAKIKAKRPAARKSPKNMDATVRDLEKRLTESLEREKATSDVLRIISRSPADLHHGGKIWVKSQVGAGSTFTFTLPLQR